MTAILGVDPMTSMSSHRAASRSLRALALLMVVVLPNGGARLDAQNAPATANRSVQAPTEEQRRARELELRRQLAEPRPIAALDSVWIEELTWMEVRDAIASGKTTAIVPTGGVEQNGPYLATGKHNTVLIGACEAIARELGNALCAPILKLVPEGDIDPPSGHMLFPGTLSLRQDTFERVLDDIGSSLHAHGFAHIVFIGDSGGNQAGMKAVAATLNERWGTQHAHFIPEFYRYDELVEWMHTELGIREPVDEGLHDDYAMTVLMMAIDPSTVRYQQRVDAGKATINGVSIAPAEKSAAIGRQLLARRVDETVAAIRQALASSAALAASAQVP